MSQLKTLTRRIKTAKNIAKITYAMELVAASKMRRAQDKASSSQPYADKLQQILDTLKGRVDPSSHPLLQPKSEGKLAVILLTTDKGLCGSYNTSLLRFLETWLTPRNVTVTFVPVGKKGSLYLVKTGQNLEAEFSSFPDRLSFEDTLAVSQIALDGFLKQDWQEVWIGYMRFVNTLSQTPHFTQLLPIINLFSHTQPGLAGEYVFEPSTQEILDWLLPYHVETQIYQAVLNAQASEHSARMVAMKSAHDNATDIVTDLTLDYNRARQAKITSELLDVITARTALGD